MAAHLKEVDGCFLDVRASFRKTDCSQGCDVFTPVKLIVTFVRDGATGNNVSRQAAVQKAAGAVGRKIKRRMRRARTGDAGNEIWIAGIQELIVVGFLKLSSHRRAVE